MNDEPIVLSVEQAMSMIGDDETIHTFRSTGFALIGSDWARNEIVNAIKSSKCEVGGPACQKVNHGLVIHMDGPLFVECKKGFDYAEFEKQVSST